MKIDQGFVDRTCRYLIRKAGLNEKILSNLSVELQLLSLVLLREVMQTPLEEFEKQIKKSHKSKKEQLDSLKKKSSLRKPPIKKTSSRSQDKILAE